MTRSKQQQFLTVVSSPIVGAIIALFVLGIFLIPAAQAQTFSVIHNFSGGGDGQSPLAGVTVGPPGVLYGTASAGGAHGYGTVFKLTHIGSGWPVSPLYEFTGGSDGAQPEGPVVIGPNGALYGATAYGGGDNYGTVFELRPAATFCRAILCYWNETVLHTFTGTPDGADLFFENLAFDPAGNIYGTTWQGGAYDYGTVFELSPSGGVWTESIPHNFGSGTDGQSPFAGVVLDSAGNVYGTTAAGGTGDMGTVYQLMPSNGGWVENILVNFDGANGSYPEGNLITDASGNLYGTTVSSGSGQNADSVVFRLAPSGGGFTYSALYTFSSPCESSSGLAMDASGNLFGVCYVGGAHQDGWIFELTNCSQTCTLVDLHDFSGSDGANPCGTPVLDAHGNLYGTTQYGGSACSLVGCGVVWEIAGVR
jgi:uncharacterized repeat protein (TIGR03803 family)